MRTESNPEKNSTFDMIPPVNPRSPWRVAEVTPYPGFRLNVRFLDGLQGWVEMDGLVHSQSAGVFSALADPAFFARAFVEYGAVTWPGEIDLAPDAMYEVIKTTGVWRLA
ncbi:MAG: DUF2442 domain-containing protein [Desulfuromonadaceae bacterium]